MFVYVCAQELDTHACMVVVAVWKVNIFSLGNQLVSSAIREKNEVSEFNRQRKIDHIGKCRSKFIGNMKSQNQHQHFTVQHSTNGERETQRKRQQRKETGRRRVKNTDHHVTTSNSQSPPDLRRNRFEVINIILAYFNAGIRYFCFVSLDW